MNVVPLLGKAMMAKSSIHEMSPMIVPFLAKRVSMGGMCCSWDCNEESILV